MVYVVKMIYIFVLLSWNNVYLVSVVAFVLLSTFFLFFRKRKNVSSSIILARLFYLSLIIELLVFPLRGISIILCSLVSFILFFFYTFYCLKKYSWLDAKKCLCVILLGCLLLTLPIRIFNFEKTLITLPDSIFHLLGIISGFLFYISKGARRVFVLLISIIVCILFFPGFDKWCFYVRFNSFSGKINEKIIHPLSLINFKGDTTLLALDQDKILVWEFWMTSCGSCFKQFPEFQKLYKQYENDTKVEFCAVNWPLKDISTHQVFQIIKDRGYTFPVAILSEPDSIYHELGIYKVPTVLIIERGTIIYRGDLLTSINVIENILKKNSCE